MKVLAVASYPMEAPSTRYRLHQFVEPLAARGIELEVRPFLDSAAFTHLYQRGWALQTLVALLRASWGRLWDIDTVRRADVLLVQREAMLWGPPWLEWFATTVLRRPMVLDLDDATYIRYVSPTYGRWIAPFKWFRKTDDLIRWARVVICGNRIIGRHVDELGSKAVIIPTIADTSVFTPRAEPRDDVPTLGWVGTPFTFPFLASIFPVLERLARQYRFRLKVVGSGRSCIQLAGIEVDARGWTLEEEVAEFQSIDIGLYPLLPGAYAEGKSGLKAIQYLALGIPFVMTPLGVCTDIGEAGRTHLLANTPAEWEAALSSLLTDADGRARLGQAGRREALRHYTVDQQADRLATVLRAAMHGKEAGAGPAATDQC